MKVNVEVLNDTDAAALAHLAWHGLVETARKTLPILVLDDSSAENDFNRIENLLVSRASQMGVNFTAFGKAVCENGSCSLH